MTESLDILKQNSENPFFSIIIPTKNRHFFIDYVIQSVLLQTFSDYEIILVDNDDSKQTQQVISRYDDTRIRYLRTGKLSMADNWEYGLNHVRGKYILLLEDKMALKTDSLIKIYEIVTQYPDYPICWRYDCYNDMTDSFVPAQDCNGTITLVKPDQIIRSFLNCDFQFFNNNSPRSLNSCTPKKITDKIKLGSMKRFFLPLSPDFNSAFQLCINTDFIVCLNKALVISGGVEYSTGIDAYTRGPLSRQFFKDYNVKSDDELYEYVPLKIYSVRNELFNEFFKFSRMRNSNLTNYPLNIANYFLFIYDELILVQSMGGNTSFEIQKWHETLERLEPLLKHDILSKIKFYDKKYQRNPIMKFLNKIIILLKMLIFKKISPNLPFIKQKNILSYLNH